MKYATLFRFTDLVALIGKEEHFRNTELNVCNLIREDVSNHSNNDDAAKWLLFTVYAVVVVVAKTFHVVVLITRCRL